MPDQSSLNSSKNLKAKTGAERAFQSLLRMLARRDHSELELKNKLIRYYDAADVTIAVNKARDERWLRPAEELARSITESLHRRGRGHRRIDLELKKRGLPKSEYSEDRELEKAKIILNKIVSRTKSTPLDYESKAKLKARAFRLLSYRGFRPDVITKLLRDI